METTESKINSLNILVKQIVENQKNIAEMLENETLPWIPSLIPHMEYSDQMIAYATRFYMHLLITRHVHEMIEMWVELEDYFKSKYADKIEAQISELISLCTGRTYQELNEQYIWQHQ